MSSRWAASRASQSSPDSNAGGMPYGNSVSVISICRSLPSCIRQASPTCSVRGEEKYGGTTNVVPLESGISRIVPL
jgi:hypothetical protein